jgi:hypothetical protein
MREGVGEDVRGCERERERVSRIGFCNAQDFEPKSMFLGGGKKSFEDERGWRPLLLPIPAHRL